MNQRTNLHPADFTREPARNETAQQPARPPAAVFRTGWVETRVWANETDAPGAWRVDQLRIYPGPDGGPRFARTLTPIDLRNAQRGLYLAERWVRRAERRSRWLTW